MNKALYKITLIVIKILPMLIAVGYMLNTILSFIGIDLSILSYICGMSFLPLLFMYLCSYVFQFCEYHRIFLHYIFINDVLNIYDLYVGIPLNNRNLFTLHLILICIILFLTLFLHLKYGKIAKKSISIINR